MKLVVGLGNPGKEYENSRHNAGFVAVDALAKDITWTKDAAHKAETVKLTMDGQSVLLARPQTFMNLSGEAVQGLISYYKIEPKDILIVQDDMDLAPGSLGFLAKGGPAGHNGIISIQERMGSDDIARLRIGTGRPTPPIAKEDWVLGKMDDATLETMPRAADAITNWITNGLEKAMNEWNRK